MDLLILRWMTTFLLATLGFGTLQATERPVIGILSQELSKVLSRHYDPKVYTSYIAASYVKYFESSGARIVPIPIGRSLDYYRELVGNLNGVVFPGGGARIDKSTGYAPSGSLLLTALEESASNGRPVPALGVCLGLELMAWYDYRKNKTAEETEDSGPLVLCSIKNVSLPLNFQPGAENSRLFSRARSADLEILKTRPITANEHMACVTQASLSKAGLSDTWHVLSTSETKSVKFISAMESLSRSFFAVVFHPEKNAFEWESTQPNHHDPDAVATMRVFGDSFVQMCRKNNNFFPFDKERRKLIYQYQTVESGAKGIAYEQIYLFRQDDLD